VTLELPPLTVHVPTPWLGGVAPNTAELVHTVALLPAIEFTLSLRIIVVLLLLQLLATTVHLNMFEPIPKPVTLLVAELGVTTVPLPDRMLQVPMPCTGVVAFKLALFEQLDTVEPAFEVTLLFNTNKSALCVHVLFFTVHVNTLLPWPKPVTPVLATPI